MLARTMHGHPVCMPNSRVVSVRPRISGGQRCPRPAQFVPQAGGIFGFLDGMKKKKTDPSAEYAGELLDLLLSGGKDQAAVSELVDTLASSELPFKEKQLRGGPWVVRYTKGAPQLWKATYNAGKALSRSNEASQDIDSNGRTVVNRAEYLGGSLWVTASGTYEPVDDRTDMPKPIRSLISSGNLHLFGLDIPLPIRGSGVFEVCYLDDNLRIFRAGSSYAVQVKQTVLEAYEDA